MVASPAPLPAWSSWLFEGAYAGAAASAFGSRVEFAGEDLDFLDEAPAAAPSLPPLVPLAAGGPRVDEARAWLNSGQLHMMAETAALWARDPRLASIDAAAALVVLTVLCQQPDQQAEAHGAVSQLIQRVLGGDDPELARLAAQGAIRLQLSEVQEALAGQLARNGEGLGPQGRSDLLAALEVLGDGRCVRAMEAFLAQWSSRLQDHEAWRARHIVQVIRRGGRR